MIYGSIRKRIRTSGKIKIGVSSSNNTRISNSGSLVLIIIIILIILNLSVVNKESIIRTVELSLLTLGLNL